MPNQDATKRNSIMADRNALSHCDERPGRKIVVTGLNGQVGRELIRSFQGLGEIVALDRDALNLADPEQIRQRVQDLQPTLIVNAAAYTAVDKAEQEETAAYQVNAIGPATLADEAKRLNIPLIHYSTDYVYNGEKVGVYVEEDLTDPQNVYGRSKLAGEQAIIASGCAHLILRTSWVYSRAGSNFVKTMLRLGADRSTLSVVADQFGAPTWARLIADMTAHVIAQAPLDTHESKASISEWWSSRSGIYHLTGGGDTSWAEFAQTIFAIRALTCKVEGIPATSYPTPAKRPSNSRLSNAKFQHTFGLVVPDWRDSLRLCLEDM